MACSRVNFTIYSHVARQNMPALTLSLQQVQLKMLHVFVLKNKMIYIVYSDNIV
jgi:hypothetical protein